MGAKNSMGDAAENKGMNKDQRLYPDVIYRFNALFISIWRKHNMGFATAKSEKKDVYFVPVFFSKHSRSFRWIGLDSFMWDWENPSCQDHLKGLINDLRDLNEDADGKKAWQAYLDDMPDMEVYKEAIKTVNQAIGDDKGIVDGEMHHALLALYSGSHHGADKNIEGVVYHYLSLKSHDAGGCFDHLKGDLRLGKKNKKPPFNWLKIGVDAPHFIGADENRLQHRRVSNIFLDHLLLHNGDFEDVSFGRQIAEKRTVALIPLYDLWPGGHGYGGIKAVIIVWFENKLSRRVWLTKKFPKLRNAFPELAEEVRESAETLAASLPITPPYDLVRHFLKVLSCVQDWESAAVFDSGELQYGYKSHKPKSGRFKFEWNCFEKGKAQAKGFSPRPNLPESSTIICEPDGKRYMWWTAGENDTTNLWAKEFIPGLSVEEVNRFGNLSIRFEFSKATHIPSDEEVCSLLYQEYLRQQLDLMRMLIPKVRARRSALRNAAVSIMARNMSHNIGSHVLAAVRGDTSVDAKGNTKQFNRLNEHLQRRMDFIAELATVESLYAADNLLFQEVLGVKITNGSKEELVNGNAAEDESGLNVQKLLLKHISGSQKGNGDAVPAEIHVICPNKKIVKEANVSFNSGVLGWQAFYVILENIIRNVAKHAPDPSSDKINIYLKILDNDGEFFEVRIWDSQEKANKPVKGKFGPTVVEYLADTLAQPSFLDDDNTVATKDWGMKEIYISAAFLRGIALSDLENQLPKPAVIQVCAMGLNGEVKGDEKEEPSDVNECTYENLGFKFYLPKAKNVAIIVNNVDEWWGLFDVAGRKVERTDMEKALKENGVDFFSVGDACTRGTKIPHRYGMLLCTQENLEEKRDWDDKPLSTREILEKRRAELPLDLLEKEGMEKELTLWLVNGEVQEAIKNIRNQVLEQRLRRMVVTTDGDDFQLWMEDIQLNGNWCGSNLNDLHKEGFKKAVVFDNHGSGIKRQLGNRWRKGKPSSPFSPSDVKFAFYESFRTAFPQTGLFASLLHCFGIDGFKIEAQCAALTPVLILDERFQRIAARLASSACQGSIPQAWANGGHEFFMRTIWDQMRVFVPRVEDCNLEEPKLEEIKKYLMGIRESLGSGAFVVVHQTIFDKLSKAGEEKELANHLAGQTKSHGWINVVCSGRGVPWQLRDRDHNADYHPRFIALSALLQCLEHMPSKLHLIRLLEVTRAT
jgi:hypothetical protein